MNLFTNLLDLILNHLHHKKITAAATVMTFALNINRFYGNAIIQIKKT
jgi:hypothetical protein